MLSQAFEHARRHPRHGKHAAARPLKPQRTGPHARHSARRLNHRQSSALSSASAISTDCQGSSRVSLRRTSPAAARTPLRATSGSIPPRAMALYSPLSARPLSPLPLSTFACNRQLDTSEADSRRHCAHPYAVHPVCAMALPVCALAHASEYSESPTAPSSSPDYPRAAQIVREFLPGFNPAAAPPAPHRSAASTSGESAETVAVRRGGGGARTALPDSSAAMDFSTIEDLYALGTAALLLAAPACGVLLWPRVCALLGRARRTHFCPRPSREPSPHPRPMPT